MGAPSQQTMSGERAFRIVKSACGTVRQLTKQLVNASYPEFFPVVFVGVLAFVGSAAMGFLQGIPEPWIHDEFSYLLAADTFAHGRLTNPTHPMWVHFETMHVIHQPTYMSKFMPVQGLFLAVGRVVGGHPIAGVWLSMAFMCAAICWMLQAWVPRRWALLGALFAIVHPNFGIGSYWAQSYWGAAACAGGGALLLGGARRVMSKPRKSSAVFMGLGLVILANSRPYEGLILSLPVGFGLLIWLLGKHRPTFGAKMRQVIVPLAIVGILTLSGMAYYNYRVTGWALQIPYLIHEQTYSIAPLFIWQKPAPRPNFRHKIIEDFHVNYELPYYVGKHSISGFIKVNLVGLIMYLAVAGSVFMIPMIGSAKQVLSWLKNNIWGRFAVFVYAFFVSGMMIETFSLPHYWAPITALNYLFVAQGIRFWRARDRRMGQIVLLLVPFLALTLLASGIFQANLVNDPFTAPLQRATLLKKLKQGSDRHLIVVSYGPHHAYSEEWVFNEADIDDSKVVWARAMDPEEDCKLVQYFKDRKIWSLNIDYDDALVRLKPFPNKACE
jgi:hypothetical protein